MELTTLNFNECVLNSINKNRKKGRVFMVIGPMFSGKTTTLIELAEYIINKTNKSIGLFNSNIDTRYAENNMIVSHDNKKIPCLSVPDNKLYDECKKYDIILINEGQFINGLYDTVKNLLDLKKTIVVSGLDMDYKQQWFEEMWHIYYNLCYNSNKHVLKRVGFCDNCKNSVGQYSYRIVKNDNNRVVLGGKEDYLCVCTECYNTLNE